MAEKHIANAEASWRAVCVTPDLCKVGKKVIPFDSFRDLSHDMVASPDVNARGTPVYRISDWVEGTDSNAGKGIVSGTSGAPGHVQMLNDGTTVRVNGLVCARDETVVLMNYGAGPNTVGKLQTDQGAPLGVADNGKLPCNDPPKTSDRLERLEEIKQKLAFMDPDQFDEWVRFGDAHEFLDELISGIDVETDGEYGWAEGATRWAGDKAAQGTRAVVGFGKDVVLGLGQLLYGATKVANPAGLIHTTLDAQILAEHIKLGNICLESLKQAAAATGQALAKPVTDAWERGDHVEAVTRAGLEIGTLVVAVGQVAKAATATRAGTAGAAAAGAADDVGRAGGAAAATADDAARAAGAGVVDDTAKVGSAEVAVTKSVDAAGKPRFETTAWNGVKIKARRLRDLYLGRTPSKGSKTGREVIAQMEKDGKIIRDPVTGEPTHFMDSKGNWRPMADGDMAHNADAVKWWNETGREYGARSPEVRDWMLNSENYTIDYYGYNRSAGASLPDVYMPPLKR